MANERVVVMGILARGAPGQAALIPVQASAATPALVSLHPATPELLRGVADGALIEVYGAWEIVTERRWILRAHEITTDIELDVPLVDTALAALLREAQEHACFATAVVVSALSEMLDGLTTADVAVVQRDALRLVQVCLVMIRLDAAPVAQARARYVQIQSVTYFIDQTAAIIATMQRVLEEARDILLG